MTPQLSSNTQNKWGLLKMKILFCLSVSQIVPNRYFRVINILDDGKQLNIRNISSTTSG